MTEHTAGTRRVLVVEDSFLTAESIADMLRGLGYDVVGPVPTTTEAHRVLDDEERVDAALLDVNLRGEVVTSVAERLRELGRPFAFLTADPDLEQLPEGYRELGHIPKPCTPDALRTILGTLLSPP